MLSLHVRMLSSTSINDNILTIYGFRVLGSGSNKEANSNKIFMRGNTYIGKASNGMEIVMYIDSNGQRKFTEYIFRGDGCNGKEAVFTELGYSINDSQYLTQLFKEQGAVKWANNEYTMGIVDEFGQRIDIEIILEGKGTGAGKTSYLKSGWMIKTDGTLQMNTPFAGFTR